MTLNHIMNEQLHEHLNTVKNDCLGFGAVDIDFLPNLKISLNLKKSMSNLYFKDLKVKKIDCGLGEI